MSTPNVAHATLPTAQLIEAVQLPPVRQADTGQEQIPQALFAAIKGDPGPPGPGGAGYNHIQTSAADVWVVAHNLGFFPSVAVFTPGGIEMMGTVQHLGADVLQISFSTPVAGSARLN